MKQRREPPGEQHSASDRRSERWGTGSISAPTHSEVDRDDKDLYRVSVLSNDTTVEKMKTAISGEDACRALQDSQN